MRTDVDTGHVMILRTQAVLSLPPILAYATPEV